MDDLLLFRCLTERRYDDERLEGLLVELAVLPLSARSPFLGLLVPLVEAPGALRALALRCLVGCEGYLAARLVVERLGDEDEGTAQAALGWFQKLAASQPMRWAHVVFHADARVRRSALEVDAPLPAASLAFCLLADEACREPTLARFVPGASSDATLVRWPLPPRAPATVLAMEARGVLEADVARRLLASVNPGELGEMLTSGRIRTEARCQAWLEAAARATEPPRVDDPEVDDLDRLLVLLDLEPDQDGAPTLAGRLSALCAALPSEALPRLAAALVRRLVEGSVVPLVLLDLLVQAHPPALAFAWLPREVRRQALRSVYRRGDGARKTTRGVIEDLVESDLAVHAQGGLDLWVLGGLLHLAPGAPLEMLFGWVKIHRVLDAFVLRPEESAPLLSIDDRSSHGTAFLLDALRRRQPERAVQLTSLWALTAPLDQLDAIALRPRPRKDRKLNKSEGKGGRKKKAAREQEVLAREPEKREPISAAEAVEVCVALRQAERQGLALASKRAERLGQVLAPLLLSEPAGLLGLGACCQEDEGVPEASLSLALLTAVAQALSADELAARLAALPAFLLYPLVVTLARCAALPYAKERAVAQALVGHADEALRAWARERLPVEEVKGPPVSLEGKPLSEAEAAALASCADGQLDAQVRALGLRRSGLAAALRRRERLGASAEVCAALLCCDDSLGEVDELLAVVGREDEVFSKRLAALMVERTSRSVSLPVLGHAWMMLWERHAFALLELLCAGDVTLEQGLAPYLSVVRTPWVRARLLESAGRLVGLLSYRDRDRAVRVVSEALVQRFVRELPGAAGYAAAEALVLLHRARIAPEHVASVQPVVRAQMPDLSEAVRDRLTGWVDAAGLPPAPVKRAIAHGLDLGAGEVRRCSDLDALERWLEQAALSIVEEVALRLFDLGEAGLERIESVLRRAPDRDRLGSLLALVEYWPEGEALERLRAVTRSGEGVAPEVRFALALELLRRGERAMAGAAEEAVCAPGGRWFTAHDWEQLAAAHPERVTLACALARSPQPHAYREAIDALLAVPAEPLRDDVAAGLMGFLEAGTGRLTSLRVRAAQRLGRRGLRVALPVLLAARSEGVEGTAELLVDAGAPVVEAYTRSLLMMGGHEREKLALEVASACAPEVRGEALEELVASCVVDDVRRAAVKLIEERPHRSQKLQQIAETFAWGVHRGRELLGALYQVEMVDGEALGYTRLNERRVFVSPLPLLRRERHGRELVEGLILHELGHHRYHRGAEAEACWKQSEKEGLQRLYNLVLDEHLERNLRAVDEAYGDRLKLLASYAFQHSTRAVPVEALLASTGVQAAQVLPRCRLGVARRSDQVVVDSGGVLQGLERQGMSFARFLRALRMGLGDRHGDERVGRALALFRGGFRRKSVEAMLDVARELQRLFGAETMLLGCTGSHESLTDDPAEGIAHGDAISPAEVAEEVERVLNPQKRPPAREGKKGPSRPWINVNPSTQFQPISSVTRLVFERGAAEALALRVRRQAFHLRRFLEDLGLSRVNERRRVQGHRFDPSRVQAMVLRNDPRVLVARRLEIHADVFLGLVVDCSGSMQAHGRIERARLFAALIAEAARGLAGVDVRVFGFTDQVIYDAGDASFCAAHALQAGGGNNDAAALWHVAQVARQSRRRSRVLVMISDGLPTECSVEALRAVVEHLSRREHMVCAQVAVAPITEVLFPHRVLLDGALDDSVRRFGTLIGALVRRSLSALFSPRTSWQPGSRSKS